MAFRFRFSFHCLPLPLGRYLCGDTDLDCCHSARASGILLNVLGTSFHLRPDCSVLLFTRAYLSLSSLDSHSPEKSRGPEEPKGLVLLFTKFEGAVPLTSIVLMGHGGELHDAR